jgi:hypothetical protein
MSMKINKGGGTMWLVATLILVLGAITLFVVRASNPPDFDSGAEASGVAAVGALVVEGAEITLGDVPLNVTVTPTWTLVNEGTAPVSLGEPHATVVEGCCPGPLALSATTLAPGESAELTFPLQMHPGMDGPHRFDVHVPVGSADDYLTLGVTGDFG